jgi:peroxiredoxin
MKKVLLLMALIVTIFVQAQKRQYTYYMNDQMQDVAKQNATILGRGSYHDSVFVIQFYTASDNGLFLSGTFTDSTLNVLHGQRLIYHTNGVVAEKSYYQQNMLHGPTIKKDSLNRITDSTMYFEDVPGYLIQYGYRADGSRQVIHEFGNGYARTRPADNATVILAGGRILEPGLWKPLLYDGRYAFKEDKVAPNTFLVFRFGDHFYNKMVARDPKPKESEFFKTGQPFVINETDIDGKKLKSKDLKGKVLVINYWFVNCPPCRKEIPDLNDLVRKYKDSANVKFIGIALDDREALKDFLKIMPFHYQIVADGRAASARYGVKAFPTHVIVDGDGKVYFHTVSSPRQLFFWMSKTIDELLEKQRLSPVPVS